LQRVLPHISLSVNDRESGAYYNLEREMAKHDYDFWKRRSEWETVLWNIKDL